MTQKYIGVHFTVEPAQPGIEILLAELGQLPFDSFEETPNGLSAYMAVEHWNENVLEAVSLLKNPDFEVNYTTEEIPVVNWNETWESHFEPISIDHKLHIRAPFHPPANTDIEIVIMPKMSFGTGHHETTFLMAKMLLDQNFEHQTVLDMGSGTAILAIIAEKRGAAQIDAIDIDPWCFENGKENIVLNRCSRINVRQGDASVLGYRQYDCIIANINRNILLQDLPAYHRVLKPNGQLFLSGFYEADFTAIDQAVSTIGYNLRNKESKNQWVAAQWVKAGF